MVTDAGPEVDGTSGPLAFVGGGEWQEGCDFDARLLEQSGADEVVVLPTAAAYEHPGKAVARAREWFGRLGAAVHELPVLARADAADPAVVEALRCARFIYLGDGSTLHLRSVIKDSPAWGALVDAWRRGAVVAGSAAGAMILGDPMVDPRGGAFTLGLGLVRNMALVPHWERWSPATTRRMLHLLPAGVVAAEIPERTALVRWADGTWEAIGAGEVSLALDGSPTHVGALEGVVAR